MAYFFLFKTGGYKNAVFKLIKFRTMTMDVGYNKLLEDNKRITIIGKFLREASLDELPSLINVFKGDMSFIGQGLLFLNI